MMFDNDSQTLHGDFAFIVHLQHLEILSNIGVMRGKLTMHAADLRLCFCICKSRFSNDTAHFNGWSFSCLTYRYPRVLNSGNGEHI